MDLQKLIEYMQLHEQIWTESLMDGSNDSMHEINRTHTQTQTHRHRDRDRHKYRYRYRHSWHTES